MKRIIIIWITLLTNILVMQVVNVSGKWICIDPGHGGPDARKYGCNGGGYNNYNGAVGPVDTLTEQWVNLQVALAVRDSLLAQGHTVLMTRIQDTTNIPYWYRVNLANYGYYDEWPVDEFVSIHHNGLPLGAQGTEVWWSSTGTTDSFYVREGWDSTLAMKIQMRLVNKWDSTGRYTDRCSYPRIPGHECTFCCDDCCYWYTDFEFWVCCWQDSIRFVLRNTIPPAALSEASNLNDTLEEHLFDTNFVHIEEEADAIFRGVQSYIEGMGIAVVKNAFVDTTGMELILADWDQPTDSCVNEDMVNSPYLSCWLVGETYCLKAITPVYFNGYSRSFHHWSHVDADGYPLAPDWYDPIYKIVVPVESDYHRYTAYFSGGPYFATVTSPNGGEVWNIDQQANIDWEVSMGADSTTLVDIFLDRNGGNGGYPETLATNIWAKIYSSFYWTVSGSPSTQCRIKIFAHDLAGNETYDVSDNDFIISSGGPALWLTSPNGGEVWEAQSQHDITWESYNYDGDSVHLRYTKDGSNWFGIVDTPNDGVYTWTLPSAAETLRYCRVKVRDLHELFPYDISDSDFTITPGPLYPPTLSAGYSACLESGTWIPCVVHYCYIPAIEVKWTDNNYNELGYKIERKDSTHMVWEEVGSAPKWATSYIDTLDLIGSQTYWYRVRAYNQAGCSDYSNERRVRNVPNPPTNFTGTLMGGNTNVLFLSWEPPENQILPISWYKLFVTDYAKKCDRWYLWIYGLSYTLCLDAYLDSGWCYYVDIQAVIEDSLGYTSYSCGGSPLYIVPGRTELCWPELCQADEFAICGDANDDANLTIADVVFLVTYLYLEGPAPHEPIERADVNNDCEVDIADIIYLTNYLCINGPLPECCWIH